jgi:hypothetical protein
MLLGHVLNSHDPKTGTLQIVAETNGPRCRDHEDGFTAGIVKARETSMRDWFIKLSHPSRAPVISCSRSVQGFHDYTRSVSPKLVGVHSQLVAEGSG